MLSYDLVDSFQIRLLDWTALSFFVPSNVAHRLSGQSRNTYPVRVESRGARWPGPTTAKDQSESKRRGTRATLPSTPLRSAPSMMGMFLSHSNCRRELDAMPDPQEAYRKRGAHWTFNGERFLREVGKAKENGSGAFPGFDHAAGDPVEGEINVRI